MPRTAKNKSGKPGAKVTKKQELVITRIFDAPREIVWKTWTEPDRVKRWWGPEGFTAPFCRIDLRVGGTYLYCMRSPEGRDYWSTGVYRGIVPQERIVCTDSFADENGNVVPASHYGMDGDWPLELVVTVTFEEQRGRTKFTLRHEGFPSGEQRDLAKDGWSTSLDKLEKVLGAEKSRRAKTVLVAEPGKQEASVIRIFDAPSERVFGAFTDPDLMTRWWAPERFTIIIEKLDVRPGGAWRILNRDAEGNEYAFHGVYHEVSKPSRLVYTFEFDGMPGHVLLGIVTFEDLDGRTKLTEKSVFESVEDRDGMIRAGMEEGAPETMDRLAVLVENE